MRTYLCLAALLMMAGCTNKPNVAPMTTNQLMVGTGGYAKPLHDDKWGIAHLTVDPKMETVQVTKYRYACPEGYALATYGHLYSAWAGSESTQMSISQVTMPPDGLLNKQDDKLTCLYMEPPKKSKP